MNAWCRGRWRGLAGFGLIAALVVGALGGVTASALRLEQQQHQDRAEAEHAGRVRLALWRLDSRVAPLLAREDSRPYNHYSALYAPALVVDNDGVARPAGSALELSPLLNADLPDWMLLHFQAGAPSGWGSPQVPFSALAKKFKSSLAAVPRRNVTPARATLLDDLSRALPAERLVAEVQPRGPIPHATHDTALVLAQTNWSDQVNNDANNNTNSDTRGRFGVTKRATQEMNPPQQHDKAQSAAYNIGQGRGWLGNRLTHAGTEVCVGLHPMVPVRVTPERGRELLLLVRLVQIENEQMCQGVVLDEARLCRMLLDEIQDFFPAARLTPVRSEVAPQPERAMAALPLQLDPNDGPVVAEVPTWTPLRLGLALAWVAALVALTAVGLGGWSLLDLSERRFRFVSAVTHELRTPLTTLRLYLDMLLGGMVRDDRQRQEYIQTLHQEADRLSRLVSNVLDYARLERQRPRLVRIRQPVLGLIEQLRTTWQGRCEAEGKQLLVDSAVTAESWVETDGELVQQVVGNLLDNACKYSRAAVDTRLWLRAQQQGAALVIEVEDCGPGVPAGERGSIFHPFQRGRDADVTAGGVGLGLALARQWAELLGGTLTLRADGPGACFRLELPSPSL